MLTIELPSVVVAEEAFNPLLPALPDLVWGGRPPTVELVTLTDDPHRTLFTSTRTAAAARPAIVAVRELLTRALAPQS